MIVSGYNKYLQLSEKSTALNSAKFPIVSPPQKSNLEISTLLSYSICMKGSIWVTSNGRAYAIGDNQKLQISGSLPKKIIEKETEIIIKDEKGNPYKFISALCDSTFSLYILSPADGNDQIQLAYVYKDKNNGNPLFLNIGNRKPAKLFGAYEKSAFIDSEGAIFVVTAAVYESPKSDLQPSFLPEGEKATLITFSKTHIFALSTNGRVFESILPTNEKNTTLNFSEIPELIGKKIIHISSFINHYFAVTSDGVVFGRGANNHGQLCFKKEEINIEKFTEISALKKFKIKAAYAGGNFSLFQTFDGKILASGTNWCGELLLESGASKDDFYTPVETTIKSGATFCIIGSWISTVFVNVDPPPNTPNLFIPQVNENPKRVEDCSQEIMSLKDQLKDEIGQHETICIEKIELIEKQIEEITYTNQKVREYEEFQQREKAYLSKIEFLSCQIESLKKEEKLKNDELKNKVESYLQTIKSLEEKLAIEIKNKNDFQLKNELLQKQIDDINYNYQKAMEINESLKKQDKNSDKLKNEVEELHIKVKTYIQTIKSLKDQLYKENQIKEESLQREIEYKQKNELLEKQIEEINYNNQKVREFGEFKQREKEYLSKIDFLSHKIQRCKSDEKLIKEVEELQNKEKEYLQKINSLETQIEQLKSSDQSRTDSQGDVQKRKIEIFETSQFDKLKRIKKIGRGATSEVFKVIREEVYALKILDRLICEIEEPNDKNTDEIRIEEEEEDPSKFTIDIIKIQRFCKEYDILASLDHPNIIKVYGFYFGDVNHEPAILLEYCPFSLKSCVKKLTDKERVQIIIELSEAMKHVHSLGIIHRDLKPENILLDSNKHVKLSDFGISTLIDNNSQSKSMTQMIGTLQFMSPELIKCEKSYNEKVDVYSFGIVLYILLMNGEYPSFNLSDVFNGKKMEIPEKISQFSRSLIDKCWSTKPQDRPSFVQICELIKQNQSSLI